MLDGGMNATDRAAQLGTEHGTRAAEEWRQLDWHFCVHGCRKPMRWCEDNWQCGMCGDEWPEDYDWPEPDLEHAGLGTDLNDPTVSIVALVDAYEAAFTAAVETTIRQSCETV